MPVPSTLLRRAIPALVLAVAVLTGPLAACGGERPEVADRTETTTTTAEATTTTAKRPPPGPEVAQAKQKSIDVYESADASTAKHQIVAGVHTKVDTIPIVFFVKKREHDADRLQVYLPIRPNGSSGWVNASDVTVAPMRYRIEVGITEHRLRVYKDDKVILDEPVGVGRTDRPTPGGVYYLTQLLRPPNQGGAYGVYAYGLSGFSDVLQSFAGGPGEIGIHGTNEPDKIGSDVSSGCIRMHNDAITRMAEDIGLPLGTPVEINA